MRSSSLHGRVVDAEGQPIAGATVYFVQAPVALPDIAQLTGPDGLFALGTPVPGLYRIGVNAPGHPVHEQDVQVGGAAPMVVDIHVATTREDGNG